MLLDKEIDVNTKGERYDNALQIALVRDYDQVI